MNPLSSGFTFNAQGGQNSVITGGQFLVVISIYPSAGLPLNRQPLPGCPHIHTLPLSDLFFQPLKRIAPPSSPRIALDYFSQSKLCPNDEKKKRVLLWLASTTKPKKCTIFCALLHVFLRIYA
jgi:hypothetical protein